MENADVKIICKTLENQLVRLVVSIWEKRFDREVVEVCLFIADMVSLYF